MVVVRVMVLQGARGGGVVCVYILMYEYIWMPVNEAADPSCSLVVEDVEADAEWSE